MGKKVAYALVDASTKRVSYVGTLPTGDKTEVEKEIAAALKVRTDAAKKAGKASWAGLTKEERSARASANRAAGWAKKKAAKATQEATTATEGSKQ